MRCVWLAIAAVQIAAVSALLLPQWLPAQIATFRQDAAGDRPASPGFVDQQATLQQSKSDKRVRVSLGVMAKCPDAELCEGIFDKVIDRVGELVDLELVYIANVNMTENEFGVSCKHGREECLANIHQLCVRQANPDPSAWFQDYVNCVNWGPDRRIGDEDVARECAQLAHIDWDRDVAPCVRDDGPRLLRESAERAALLGIERSCTILYDERVVCIHDEVWVDCDRHEVGDFVSRIHKEYDRINAD